MKQKPAICSEESFLLTHYVLIYKRGSDDMLRSDLSEKCRTKGHIPTTYLSVAHSDQRGIKFKFLNWINKRFFEGRLEPRNIVDNFALHHSVLFVLQPLLESFKCRICNERSSIWGEFSFNYIYFIMNSVWTCSTIKFMCYYCVECIKDLSTQVNLVCWV